MIFRLARDKRLDLRVGLEKEIKEAEKEIEDVKIAEEKLRRLRVMEERAVSEHQRLKHSLEDKINSNDIRDSENKNER